MKVETKQLNKAWEEVCIYILNQIKIDYHIHDNNVFDKLYLI